MKSKKSKLHIVIANKADIADDNYSESIAEYSDIVPVFTLDRVAIYLTEVRQRLIEMLNMPSDKRPFTFVKVASRVT